MTESAPGAPSPGSKKPVTLSNAPAELLQRIEEYAQEDPGGEYWIQNEYEAAQLLIAMAASLKHARKSLGSSQDGAVLKQYERIYRQAVNQGKALNYLRNVSEEDAIELFGVRIRARTILIQ